MNGFTRRDFLRISAAAAAGTLVAACQPQTVVVKETVEVEKEVTTVVEKQVTTVVEKEVTVAPAFAQNQAPMLKAMVETGELPEIDERLPSEPGVVEPLEAIGKYGGTWRRAHTNLSLSSRRASEALLIFGRDATTLETNVASEWEVSNDGKVFTFYLRKGQKWSSGEPFSVDDIMFWYEDVLLNEELSPSLPSWWMPGGEAGTVEKVDDYTVRFTFSAPHGVLADQIPFRGHAIVTYPMHYLQQFHAKYGDKAELDQMIAERGFEQWFQLFGNRRDWERNHDFPVHGPWKITNGDWTTHEIADRNPYYFKVDPEGNQLPYIDKLVNAITDTEMVPMKVVGGEVDKQAWNTAIANYTLYIENQEKGDYKVYIWNYGSSGTAMHVNAARKVEDGDAAGQELRELLQNRDFRTALSKSIDRDELNTLNYKGLAAPVLELFPESVKSDPEIQALYEYDVDASNQILDDLGLTERDGEGYRLMASGERLELFITCHVSYAVHMDVAEVVTGYWREVGVRGTLDPTPNETWWPRVRAGEVDVVGYEADYTAPNLFWLTYPRALFPVETSTYWGPRYGSYYATGGNEGEEATGDLKKLQDLYEECLVTLDLEQRKALTDQAFYLLAYNLWPIHTVASRPEPCIVKNGFRNVPELGFMAWPVYGERTTKQEQYFWDNL